LCPRAYAFYKKNVNDYCFVNLQFVSVYIVTGNIKINKNKVSKPDKKIFYIKKYINIYKPPQKTKPVETDFESMLPKFDNRKATNFTQSL